MKLIPKSTVHLPGAAFETPAICFRAQSGVVSIRFLPSGVVREGRNRHHILPPSISIPFSHRRHGTLLSKQTRAPRTRTPIKTNCGGLGSLFRQTTHRAYWHHARSRDTVKSGKTKSVIIDINLEFSANYRLAATRAPRGSRSP